MTSNRPVWVYVDGVCDLFHPGHVSFFRRARALGTHLLVGLHSDAEVTSYKPAPIMSFAERLEMVRACSLVDRVVEEPVPLRCTPALLDSFGADFACHADDLPEHLFRSFYADLLAVGRIRLVPYTAGISSRGIVERVRSRRKEGSLRPEPEPDQVSA